MPGKHLTEAKEEERQRRFFTEDNEGNEGVPAAMFKGSRSFQRIVSFKPGTGPAPSQKKGEENVDSYSHNRHGSIVSLSKG